MLIDLGAQSLIKKIQTLQVTMAFAGAAFIIGAILLAAAVDMTVSCQRCLLHSFPQFPVGACCIVLTCLMLCSDADHWSCCSRSGCWSRDNGMSCPHVYTFVCLC